MLPERGRISALEGAILVFSTTVPWMLLYIPFMVIGAAGRDAWISKLLLIPIGLVVVSVVVALGNRFPGQTLVTYTRSVLGNPLGLVVGALYIWWIMSVASTLVRGFCGIISILILPRTPTVLIAGVLVFVAGVAVRGGVEVVARSALVITMIFLVGMALLLGLSARDIDMSRWFPVLASGWQPVIRGIYFSVSYAGTESVVALILVLPFLRERSHSFAALAIPTVALAVLGALVVLWGVGLFGVQVSASRPFLVIELARNIDIGGFLENLDGIFLSIWVLINFAKLSIWYYAAALSAAALLGLRDYRGVVWPLGILILELSFLMFAREADFYQFLYTDTPYMLTFEVLIPSILLVVAWIRGVGRSASPGRTSQN